VHGIFCHVSLFIVKENESYNTRLLTRLLNLYNTRLLNLYNTRLLNLYNTRLLNLYNTRLLNLYNLSILFYIIGCSKFIKLLLLCVNLNSGDCVRATIKFGTEVFDGGSLRPRVFY